MRALDDLHIGGYGRNPALTINFVTARSLYPKSTREARTIAVRLE